MWNAEADTQLDHGTLLRRRQENTAFFTLFHILAIMAEI
jgi:hypothetical protein